MVVEEEDEREALFFARRLLFPVDPLLTRSVVFIESDVPVVVPLPMVPVPVEYEPVEPEPVVVDPVEPEPVVVDPLVLVSFVPDPVVVEPLVPEPIVPELVVVPVVPV